MSAELVRLAGEAPAVGKLTDIVYVGNGEFEVAGVLGMFICTSDADDRLVVTRLMMYDPPPPDLRHPPPMKLIDLNADGRYEVLSRPDQRTSSLLICCDADGRLLWTNAPTRAIWASTLSFLAQADGDPEFEIVQTLGECDSFRVIEHDGSVGPTTTFENGYFWQMRPCDMDGDGINELIWATQNDVVAWSFREGELARIKLSGGRAVEFYVPDEPPTEPGTFAWDVERFKGTTYGSSLLTLRRVEGRWAFECSAFEKGVRDSREREVKYGKRISPDGKWWVRAVPGGQKLSGQDGSPLHALILVGRTDRSVTRNFFVASGMPGIVLSSAQCAVKSDSEFPLEAWIAWGEGIWRLRVVD